MYFACGFTLVHDSEPAICAAFIRQLLHLQITFTHEATAESIFIKDCHMNQICLLVGDLELEHGILVPLSFFAAFFDDLRLLLAFIVIENDVGVHL